MHDARTLPDALAGRINNEQRRQRIPSISAAWVRDGEVAWQHAVGTVDGRTDAAPATPATQYRIGSITKTFVAVLVLRLQEIGRLALDDRLESALPGTPIGGVRIVDLLSQSAGLQAETNGAWWERTPGRTLEELLPQLALHDLAAGRFHYSNVGFAVLAAVVERLTGSAWSSVLATELLDPLGMTRTTLRPVPPAAQGLAVHPDSDLVLTEPEHDAGAMAPAGQLWSTTADLARWLLFLQRGDDRILSASALAEMRRPRSWDDAPEQPWTRAYGLGLEIINRGGRRIYGHGGSMPGFEAALRFRSHSDGFIVCANTTNGLSAGLVHDLFGLIDDHSPAAPPVWHVDPAQSVHLHLTGEWFWGPARYALKARAAGWLELIPVSAGRGARFRPVGADEWEGQDGYFLGERLRVIRVDGRPAYLDIASFRFSRTPYDPAADIPGGVDPLGWH